MASNKRLVSTLFVLVVLFFPSELHAARQIISTGGNTDIDVDGNNDGVQFDPGGEAGTLVVGVPSGGPVNSLMVNKPGIANETGTDESGNVSFNAVFSNGSTVAEGVGGSGKSLNTITLSGGGVAAVGGANLPGSGVYTRVLNIASTDGYNYFTPSGGYFQIIGQASLYATTLNYTGDGALVLGRSNVPGETNNVVLTGSVTGTGGIGIMEFWGNTDFAGDFDTSIKQIFLGRGLVSMDTVRATTVTFKDDNEFQIRTGKSYIVTNTVADTAGDGTLTFLGAATSEGNVGGAWATRIKEYKVSGGTVIQDGNVSATTVTINGANAQLTLLNSTTMNVNDLNLTDGTLDISSKTLTLDGGTGIYTQSAGTTLKVEVIGSNSGKIDTTNGSDGTSNITAASTVTVTPSGYVADGTQYTIVDGKAGTGGVTGVPTVNTSSVLLSFAGSQANANDDLVITASRDNTYEDVGQGKGKAIGRSVEDAPSAGDMLTIKNVLDLLGSTNAISNALNQMAPVVDGSKVIATNSALNRFNAVAMKRLSSVFAASDSVKTGVSTGSTNKDFEIWADMFGSWGNQDFRDNIQGYNSSIWGIALGMDKIIGDYDNFRIGVSGGYAFSDIESKREGDYTNIDSFQGSVYSGYKADSYYIDGAFTFALNKYESNRRIVFGAIDRTAESEYYGQQYSGYLELGRPIGFQSFIITPLTTLQYTYLHLDSYTEEGAGALNLSADSEGYHSLWQGVGLNISRPFDTGIGKVIPEIHSNLQWDYIGDQQESGSALAGGGGSFATAGYDPAQLRWDFGAKLSIATNNNMTFSVDYNFGLKEDYQDQSLLGIIRFKL